MYVSERCCTVHNTTERRRLLFDLKRACLAHRFRPVTCWAIVRFNPRQLNRTLPLTYVGTFPSQWTSAVGWPGLEFWPLTFTQRRVQILCLQISYMTPETAYYEGVGVRLLGSLSTQIICGHWLCWHVPPTGRSADFTQAVVCFIKMHSDAASK